jgi:hypothetical protein
MNVPEIKKVKQKFEEIKSAQHIQNWELPYENILSRLTAAISMEQIAAGFAEYENFSWRENTEQKLSQLAYRITFSKEEKEKNTPVEHAGNNA